MSSTPDTANGTDMLRLCRSLLACHTAILHGSERTAVFQHICEALVQQGGLALAWIGMLDSGDSRVWPQAHCGSGWSPKDWLQSGAHARALADQGPVSEALRSHSAQWPGAAGSAEAVLPLAMNGSACGVLVLHAAPGCPFDPGMRDLLLQLGLDIGRALERLDEAGKNAVAEWALHESEARYSMLFSNNSLPMLVIDPAEGRIVDANPRALDFYGYAADAMTRLRMTDLTATPAEQIRVEMASAVAQQKSYFNATQRRADGSMREVEIFATPITIQGATFLASAIHDVTERRRARARIDALLQLNTVSDHFSETECLQAGLDIARRLSQSRLGVLHYVSDDQQTLELQVFSQEPLADPSPAPRLQQSGLCDRSLHSRAPEVQLGDPASGTQRSASVPVIEGGQVRLLLLVADKDADYDEFDVETLQLLANDLWRTARRARVETSLKQRVDELLVMNQKLSEIQLQLLQSEKMASIGQLAAGVAHEINNPIGFVKSNLGTLSSYASHLLEIIRAYETLEAQLDQESDAVQQVRLRKQELDYDFLAEDLTKLLAESADGVQRIGHIVADLKNFSRSGDTAKQWTDLHAGMESTINVVWNKLKYKVKILREYGELPLVYCVGSQINQVIMNLLVNAEQAIATQGTITLRTGCTGEEVWIEVQDSGCGIAADQIGHIFEPFYTSKPVGEGTGLGLSISFGIMQRHHGSITVQSTPGVGSTFRITLPVGHKESEPCT